MARRSHGAPVGGPERRELGLHRVTSENNLLPYTGATCGVAPDEVVEITMQSQSFCRLFAVEGRNLRCPAVGFPEGCSRLCVSAWRWHRRIWGVQPIGRKRRLGRWVGVGMEADRSLVRLFSPWFIRRAPVWGWAAVHTPNFGRSGFGTDIDPWG